MQTTIEVPVLVVGGSLVGMSSAMLLGHYGVRSMVVEHHRGTAIHPRAAQITQRTMEIFRTVGVEQIVRQKSAEQFVQDGAIMAVETLAGKEVAYYIANLNEGIRDLSPCERVFISQSLLEPLLKQRAEELGAELRFATEMISFEQDATGVTAQIEHRDSGETATVRARYMIAADGAHSRVRERLGIRMLGHGVFSNSITIYFRAERRASAARPESQRDLRDQPGAARILPHRDPLHFRVSGGHRGGRSRASRTPMCPPDSRINAASICSTPRWESTIFPSRLRT